MNKWAILYRIGLHGDEVRRPLQIAKGLENSRKVVIVGAGLSGLTLAYKIAKKRPDISIELIEKSSRLGGVIETWKQGEWICDIAVNASRAHPAFWRLIDELGLSEQYLNLTPTLKHDGSIPRGKGENYHL